MSRRRRRPHREVAFSFDSFLDVVANVVGIILKLIVVAWVGARSYKALLPVIAPPPLPPLVQPEPLPEPTDPRAAELAAARASLAHRHREAERHEALADAARQRSAALAAQISDLARRKGALAEGRPAAAAPAVDTALSLPELARRAARLRDEVRRAAGASRGRERLLYRVPISLEAQEEEAMFEVRQGRVTLLDAAALQRLIREAVHSKSAELRHAWSVTDVTPAAGEFRARYTVERQRQALESPAAPPRDGAFRYGVAGWEAVPLREGRGEPAEAALQPGSAFRRVVDALDARQTVVTLWVYPDSFEAYRRLRDYLHEKGVVVAGRPLPEGVPIGASPQGTASRGQ